MTEKVKVTAEQAKILENICGAVGKESMIKKKVLKDPWRLRKNLFLNDLSLDEFIRALYIGYEVEPQYKVGDWVACEYEDGVWIAQIEKIEGEKVFARWEFDRLDWNYIYDIRHATPEEIKAEKERRVWAGIGREVGELRIGDAYVYKNEAMQYVDVEDRVRTVRNMYLDGHLKGFYPAESFIEFGGGEE